MYMKPVTNDLLPLLQAHASLLSKGHGSRSESREASIYKPSAMASLVWFKGSQHGWLPGVVQGVPV
jgi:hypothetical protein